MNQLAYFEIQSSDPERDAKFYEKVFGWKSEKDVSIPIDYYRFTGAGIGGAILKRPVKVPPPEYGTNAFTCSFMVGNYDETEKTILSNGGITAMNKFAIPGKCWQGYYMDPDKNVFGIFEPDENAA